MFRERWLVEQLKGPTMLDKEKIIVLDKEKITRVIEAHLFAPVTEETREIIASELGITAAGVTLGSRVISVSDDVRTYRLQVTEKGLAAFLETDIEVAEAVLNDAVARDALGIWLLINNRVQTNEAMAQSGTVLPASVQTGSDPQYTLSALDLINGVLFTMTGLRLTPRMDVTDVQKGEVRFVGFKVAVPPAPEAKAPPLGTVDFGSEVVTNGTR